MKLSIIVPCYNEEDYVQQKVDNLRKLEYDQDKLEVFFVDGCSEDNTREKITESIAALPNWHMVESKCIGKINQINLACIGIDQ